MALAVLKPDHLGDLVLASPAIRALAGSWPDLVLFVEPRNIGLARWLFPQIEIASISFPHLVKVDALTPPAPDLQAFEAVAFLRRDGVIDPKWALANTRDFAMFTEDQDVHQTVLDYGVAVTYAPPYDIDALFAAPGLKRRVLSHDRAPERVGLSVGSGFHTNAWPITHWAELARGLSAQGVAVTVIGGPAERKLARLIARLAGLGPETVLIGGADFASFTAEVATLDLVIGSDGGTAHLCSLAAPLLSIFGSSPPYRYAPFGRRNHVVTQELFCSPCIQYASRLVNGCLSVHCMAGITPGDVLAALAQLPSPVEATDLRPHLRLLAGVSHHRREERLVLREAEQELWAVA